MQPETAVRFRKWENGRITLEAPAGVWEIMGCGSLTLSLFKNSIPA